MSQQYRPHDGGQQPNVPKRDEHGVQQFAARPQPDTCPPGMIRDASGECIAADLEG